MPTPKHLEAFRKRWGIELDDARELTKFQNRLIQELESVFSQTPSPEFKAVHERFCFLIGKPVNVANVWDDIENKSAFAKSAIYQSLSSPKATVQVIGVLQALFFALHDVAPGSISMAVKAIKSTIDYSPTIDLRLVRRKNTVTLYPAGAPPLDRALVDENLIWLEPYPKAAEYFDQALRICLAKDESKYRNLLDNLRFSLEQLLRSLLENHKSLENQKEVLGKWFKERGTHPQIANMYHTLLAQFARYQNDAVKHGVAYASSEIEFMVYLTGSFMRLLLQLHEQDIDETAT